MINRLTKRSLLLFIGDIFFISLSYILAHLIKGGEDAGNVFILNYIIIISVNLFFFYISDLYDPYLSSFNVKMMFNFLISIFSSLMLIAALTYFFTDLNMGRGVLTLKFLFIAFFCYLWRLLFYELFKLNFKIEDIVIVGAGNSGKFIYNNLKNNKAFRVRCFIDDDVNKIGKTNSPTVIGGCDKLIDDEVLKNIDSVIVAIKGIKSEKLLRCLLSCKAKYPYVKIVDMPSFYEHYFGKIPIKYIDDFWIVSSSFGYVKHSYYINKIKPILDKFFAFIILVGSLPVLLLAILLILIDDGLPILFKQERVGKNGKPFLAYKLRTMKNGMENNREKAGHKDDPRITKVGRILRKLRIDEIPQVWNVLKGDMSLIGPRALIKEEVEIFEKEIPYFHLRHIVKPGITGWAQVNYRHGATVEDGFEKLQYDLYYIKNLSIFLDIYIILKTIKVVLYGKGAR